MKTQTITCGQCQVGRNVIEVQLCSLHAAAPDLLHVAKAYVAICEAKNIRCDGAKAIIQRAERGSK